MENVAFCNCFRLLFCVFSFFFFFVFIGQEIPLFTMLIQMGFLVGIYLWVVFLFC